VSVGCSREARRLLGTGPAVPSSGGGAYGSEVQVSARRIERTQCTKETNGIGSARCRRVETRKVARRASRDLRTFVCVRKRSMESVSPRQRLRAYASSAHKQLRRAARCRAVGLRGSTRKAMLLNFPNKEQQAHAGAREGTASTHLA